MPEKDTLENIVGSVNLMDSSEVLEEYSSDISFTPRVRPRYVVKPGTADEVQEIVKWANRTMTPLVPVSSGKPHFHGNTIPSMGGSVVVDLSRMKKILRIDRRNRVAMVEPGVTFAELQTELLKEGLSPYMPLCPRETKSVIGSMLEREPITMPNQHWDSIDPFLCGEIIFGTGDKLRSGEAAGPDSLEEQWKIGKAQMVPFGLSQFDESRFISGAQGTIGIVTWATLKCREASSFKRSFIIPSETIEPLIELSYRLIRARLGDNCFILNDMNMASIIASYPEEIRELRDSLPRWVLVLSIEAYGELPEEKVEYQEADLWDILLETGELKPVNEIGGLSCEDISDIISAPSGDSYWKLRDKGGFHDIFFLTTLDKTPNLIDTMYNECKSKRFSLGDLGVYIQMIVQGTSCHCEFDLFYDTKNDAEAEKVKSLVTSGCVTLANSGGFFSRPYGLWNSIAYSRAAETSIIQRKIKKIFDPNNVLNPGKLCF